MRQDWQEIYRSRLVDPRQALGLIPSGSRVFIGTACGQPQLLVRTLIEMADSWTDLEVLHFLDVGQVDYEFERFNQHFRHNAFFIGPNTRKAIKDGRVDYTPIYLSEIPRQFLAGLMRLDVALIQVSPPLKSGYVSLGVSVDVTKTAAQVAKYVIAQVNPAMPRTMGDSFLHVSQIHAFVEGDEPLVVFNPKPPTGIAEKIGPLIADLVENNSTIQTGIGSIPQSVFPYLMDKQDLGVHTEVFTEGIIDLIDAGVITNRYKNIDQGRIVSSFCMGGPRLYAYVDENPVFEFRPSRYVNDPYIIARNDRCVAINSALMVDLTGQVCSDSLGFQFYSGIGGQVDFMRGAALSPRGRAIITLPSTTEYGRASRIVPHFNPGSGVVVTRGDIHYVVTEFGTAYLHGKSIRERVMALISIAHPSFREGLLEAAKGKGYVFKDQILPAAHYPHEYETLWKDKLGQDILFRPVKPTDERAIQELLYSLPDQDVYTRFFIKLRAFPHRTAMPMAAVNYTDNMAIVGVVGRDEPEGRERIVALAQYVRDPLSNMAQAAFIIRHDWQNRGVCTFLLNHLVRIARQNNINGFAAEVMGLNAPMLSVLAHSPFPIKSHLEYGVYKMEMLFGGQA